MLMLKLMDFLYLDGYKSLWDKYRDPDRELFQTERHSAYNNYRYYLSICIKHFDYKAAIRMRRAKRAGDYLELYEIEQQVEMAYCEE